MEFEDEAYLLAARAFGEGAAIVELFARAHGRFAAHVAGGASRRLKPLLQTGTKVRVRYRSRLETQLGSASLEAEGEGPSALFDDPAALSGLASAAAILAAALPEREPHPRLFAAFGGLLGHLGEPQIWPALYVRFEAGLLDELGFGLDLSSCAATGRTDDLAYVSPRSGRAVSRGAGEPYKAKLLPLPAFLTRPGAGLAPGDIVAGLKLTGAFLESRLFGPLGKPPPPARVRLAERLTEND